MLLHGSLHIRWNLLSLHCKHRTSMHVMVMRHPSHHFSFIIALIESYFPCYWWSCHSDIFILLSHKLGLPLHHHISLISLVVTHLSLLVISWHPLIGLSWIEWLTILWILPNHSILLVISLTMPVWRRCIILIIVILI